jgi:ELWxxDGT repeat protein
LAGVATLVEDGIPFGGINPGNTSSNPQQLTDVNGTLYFVADDGANGLELWRINSGDVAEMVEDAVAGGGINASAASSNPQQFTNVNGTLYFQANDGANGVELWRINSEGVAEMVEDAVPGGGIRPGSASSNPAFLTNVNGTLYFQANDGANGLEPWRINSGGIAEMVDAAVPGGGIRPGPANSNPTLLTNVDGTLYFRATDGDGVELWRINGGGVAEMVEDSVAGEGINPGSEGSDIPLPSRI